MSTMASQITSLSIFSQPFVQTPIKKTSMLRITGLCEGNSLVTGEFLAQRASNAEMFPFDDVIMKVIQICTILCQIQYEKWLLWVVLLKLIALDFLSVIKLCHSKFANLEKSHVASVNLFSGLWFYNSGIGVDKIQPSVNPYLVRLCLYVYICLNRLIIKYHVYGEINEILLFMSPFK